MKTKSVATDEIKLVAIKTANSCSYYKLPKSVIETLKLLLKFAYRQPKG